MTPECAPLVESLGRLCQDVVPNRVLSILRKALSFTEYEMVNAALSTVEKLALDAEFLDLVRERYYWWLREESLTRVRATADTDSAVEVLFNHLISRRNVSEIELIEAANAKNYSLRRAAINELCHRTTSDDSLATRVLDHVFEKTLPLEALVTLSQSQHDVCKRHEKRIADFLASRDHFMVSVLAHGWIDYSVAEKRLHDFIRSEDVNLRNEVLDALRKLQIQQHSKSVYLPLSDLIAQD